MGAGATGVHRGGRVPRCAEREPIVVDAPPEPEPEPIPSTPTCWLVVRYIRSALGATPSVEAATEALGFWDAVDGHAFSRRHPPPGHHLAEHWHGGDVDGV